ncbi:hypothetical protein BDZ45DRAFT_697535 [Acephala macrosclerotiorum]|nr:hypothetical protein BDZ45DRAFT_697535 [Acephala macrosclerotiorum]
MDNLWDRKSEKPPLLMDFPLEVRRVRWNLALRVPRSVSVKRGIVLSRPSSLDEPIGQGNREGLLRAATLPTQTATLSKELRHGQPVGERIHDQSVLKITPAVFWFIDASFDAFRNFLRDARIRDQLSEHKKRDRRIAISWEMFYSIWPSRRKESLSRFMDIMHAITQAGILEVILVMGTNPIPRGSTEIFAIMSNPPPQIYQELVSEDRIRDWAQFMYVLGIRGHRSSGEEWIQDEASLIIHRQVSTIDWNVIARKVYEGVEIFRQSLVDAKSWSTPTFKFRVVATLEETREWLRGGARKTSWV